MVLILNFEDSHSDSVTNFDHFLRMFHTAVAELGDVDETFQIAGEVKPGKSAETRQTGDFSFNKLTGFQVLDLL